LSTPIAIGRFGHGCRVSRLYDRTVRVTGPYGTAGSGVIVRSTAGVWYPLTVTAGVSMTVRGSTSRRFCASSRAAIRIGCTSPRHADVTATVPLQMPSCGVPELSVRCTTAFGKTTTGSKK
jgi:hypothetical protein